MKSIFTFKVGIKNNFVWSLFLLVGLLHVFTVFSQETIAVKPIVGDGSLFKPYEIENLAHLRWVSETNEQWDKFFIQVDDIDASDTRNWNNKMGFSSIGSQIIPFTGVYNGRGYRIDRLYINRPEMSIIGLFGAVFNATIENVHINGAMVTGYSGVAALLGSTSESTNTQLIGVSVTNSSVTGNSFYIGALVGYMEGTAIRNSSSGCNEIIGKESFLGGLVGYMFGHSTIENSFATSNLQGVDYIGGIVGYMVNGSGLVNVYSTGIVESSGVHVGGLVGEFDESTIVHSYYDKQTSFQTDVGNGKGLSTAQFMMASEFDSTWYINHNVDSLHPWIQMEGQNRPYLYTQNILMSNGLVTKDSLSTYLSMLDGEKIIDRGFRYSKISDTMDWTIVPSNNTAAGMDKQEVKGKIPTDITFYIQPYAEYTDGICYGNMVRYTVFDKRIPTIKPIASNVGIDGIVKLGDTLIGRYDYTDYNGLDQGNTLYKWYVSDDAMESNKKEIVNALGLSYTLVEADKGKYISFEVMPSNGFIFGDKVESNLYRVVGKIPQTISGFDLPSHVDVDHGDTLTALSTSGLLVGYSVNDTNFASISDGKITFIKEGRVDVTAFQLGDSVYGPAPSVSVSVEIGLVSGMRNIAYASRIVSVYPNPVQDRITIDVSELNLSSVYDVIIYTITGKKVCSNTQIESYRNIDISMIDMVRGVYIIQILTQEGIICKRIIKV